MECHEICNFINTMKFDIISTLIYLIMYKKNSITENMKRPKNNE